MARSPDGHLVAVVLAVVVALVGGCGVAPAPAPDPDADRVARSRALLELQVRVDDGPGCIAAVGERGAVRWQGVRGYADLEGKVPISDATTFELASVSKGFTALAVLLLAQDGKLALTDPVSRRVAGLPDWGDDVTLEQLVHQRSGVPEYFPPLTGGDPTAVLDRRAVLRRIAASRRLDFAPGSRFAYSNSNYVLLAEVVEQASGQTFPDFLQERVFAPLGLAMVTSTGGRTPGLAPSYERTAGGWETQAWRFDATGAVGVRSSVVDLVRWADDYRTGTVGGRALLEEHWADAPETGLESSRYGPGLFRLPDGTLFSEGFFGGYRSGLLVSPDRERSAVLLCNRTADVEPYDFTRGLAQVWGFG